MAEIINMNIPPPPAGPLGPPPMMAGPGGLQPGPNRLPPHPNMQIMGGPPMHMPPFNMPQNFPRVFQPTYEGFTLRKDVPEPGQRPSWSRVKRVPFSVSASEFAQQNKAARTQRSVTQAYDNLKTDSQRDAIDRILEDARIEELNPFAELKLAYLKPHRRVIPGTFGRATETTDIRMIIKRMPRTAPASQLAKFGGIIDTSESQQDSWMQQQQQIQQQQQQQQMQEQQMMMMNQGPPPPPMMMGGGGGPPGGLPGGPPRLPPPPHMPPPGAKQGGGGPPVMHGNEGGPPKANKPPKQGGNNVPKPPKAQSRSSSPNGEPIRTETKTVKEKVMEWADSPDGRRKERYDSDDSNKATYAKTERTVKHKTSGPLRHSPRNSFEGERFMSGANQRNGFERERNMSGANRRSPPPILRKPSPRGRNSPLNGKRIVRRTVETYAPSDLTSEDSFEMINRRSSLWDSNSDDAYTDPSSVSSYGSGRGRKYHGDGKLRLRSRSRTKPRDDRHVSRRLRSRDRRDSSRNRRDNYREHHKPEKYRGLSPPLSDSSRGSRSSRGSENRKPIIVNNHIHTTDAAALIKGFSGDHVPSLPLRNPSPAPRYREARAIAYNDDTAYQQPCLGAPPHAPMAPAYDDRFRQRQAAAELYINAGQRRSDFAAREDQRAIDRARQERDAFNAQRTRDVERRLESLRLEEERKRRDVERGYAEAQRHSSRYPTYGDRYTGPEYGLGIGLGRKRSVEFRASRFH